MQHSEGRIFADVMRLVREARQCGRLVVHIVGWGGRSALTTGGSLLQDCVGGEPSHSKLCSAGGEKGWGEGGDQSGCSVISKKLLHIE
jgi:hypothetical protein